MVKYIGKVVLGENTYHIKDIEARTNLIDKSEKGAASGVATLDANGKVPSSLLPSYVDDVLEYESSAEFPVTGESSKIYVDLLTNKTYRWGGSDYVEISKSLALGETSSTAYRGDKGKTAYTHATDSSRLTTATSVGLYKVGCTAHGHISGLTAITKADITGLGIPAQDTNTTYSFAGGTNKFTVTPSGGTAQDVTVTPSISAATQSAAGLMSAADKNKLDGIATGATKVTTDTVSGWGYTKNTGTITGIKMNGASKGTSGVVDLGTIITAHQDISGKVDKTTTVNGHALSGNVSVTKSDVGLGNVTNDAQVKRSEMGAASGVATLDSNGKVPSSQLPSYVDDVVNGYYYNGSFYKEAAHTTVITGEESKIYVDIPTDKSYRWSGSSYILISNPYSVDEEDLTVTNNVIKFNDRPNTDGMGRIILRKNMISGVNTLTQSMMTQTNTIYVIQYDFDLGGATITIPENCVLEFDGGSLNEGFLTGSVAIINQPDNLFENVDCSGLYISTMKHLSIADVLDTFDNYTSDELVATCHRQNSRGNAHFYSIGDDSVIYYIATGNNTPSVRFLFYDENFKFLSRSAWGRNYTREIPSDAKYIGFTFNFSASDIPNIDSLLGTITFSFINNTRIYIDNDRIQNATNTQRKNIDTTITTNNVKVVANSWKYRINQSTHGENCICIPYSAFKDYDYLVATANDEHSSRIYILKNEPKDDSQIVEFSDYYVPTSTAVNQGLRKDLVIPPDAKYIIVTANAWTGEELIDQTPATLYLCTKDYLYTNESPSDSEQSNRNVNTYSKKFMHWNIGHFSNGGVRTNITEDNYNVRKSGYNNFFDRYYDYDKLFNEYDDVFAIVNGVKKYTRNEIRIKRIIEEFPKSHNYHQLGYVWGAGLYQTKYGIFDSTKDIVNTQGISHYGCSYLISRHLIGSFILSIMHFHLPNRITDEQRAPIINEILKIASGYNNVILVGDFNINLLTSVSSLSAFTDAGYSILNDNTPTCGESVLDLVLYKTPSFTVSDFSVCTDAIDANEDALSDHWPVCFTVTRNTQSVIEKDKGSYRFNIETNTPEWSDGENWLHTDMHKNLKILSIGDSILRGVRNGNKAFFPYITTDYKQDAISGSRISGTSSSCFPQQLLDENSYTPDIIIVGTGINDWNQSVPLGTPPTTMITNDTDAAALDRTKVYDAVQYLFYQMMKKYPYAKRYFISTIKFDRDFGGTSGVDGNYCINNTQGYSYMDLLEGIKKICKRYGVIFIDVIDKCFVSAEFPIYKAPTRYADVPEEDRDAWNATYYIDADGSHPTDRCYREVFAPIIRKEIE